MKTGIVLFISLILATACPGQDSLDWLDDKLRWQSRNGWFRTDLSVLFDGEGYYVDQRPPGLLYPEESFINPRASFFLDTLWGQHLYSMVHGRIDRGFDPGSEPNDVRFDEYFARWTPFHHNRVNVQLGKFATVVGNWVQRHDSWQNPLITAPLPYENITKVSDWEAPVSRGAFLARRGQPDQKEAWVPVIWGPVYATGGALFGSMGKMDYAFDLKNASLSSRPYAWSGTHVQWQNPTFSSRLGWRPNVAWNHGISFSVGPYLYHDAESTLPLGKDIGDYNQIVLASDITYERRRWQWWGEVFLTRFEVPNVHHADSLAYYLEAKYKLTPGLFAAARWNQQLFGSVPDDAGGRQPWDNDMIRMDLALGYRFTRHLQSKIQYSYSHRQASLQQGEQLVAVQVTLKF